MRTKSLSLGTAAGGTQSTATVPVDFRQNPFNLAIGIQVTGTVAIGLQTTDSNLLNGATAVWVTHATITGLTADGNHVLTVPVKGVRFQNVGAGSTGSAVVQIWQD
jgi:hypothetical protein